MMHVRFVIVSIGGYSYTYYEKDLSQSECYMMAAVIDQSNEHKASCQIQNSEV